MIESVGIDLVEVDRVRRLADRWGERFLSRVFTSDEIDYCLHRGEGYRSLAARFAAKEAVFKAVGLGWSGGVRWKDVEVVSDGRSKPEVILRGRLREMMGGGRVLISISHTEGYAVAVAVVQGIVE